MDDETKDYVQSEDEEIALPFLEKCKRIWEVSKWLRTVYYAIKFLIFGTLVTGAVGQAIDEPLLRDAALEIGIVEETFRDENIAYDEIDLLITSLREEVDEMKIHSHVYPEPDPPPPLEWPTHEHKPPPVVIPVHEPHQPQSHDHPSEKQVEYEALVGRVEELEAQMPPEHLKVH